MGIKEALNPLARADSVDFCAAKIDARRRRRFVQSFLKTLLGRWRQDYAFRTMVSAGASFAMTTLFALYNGFLGLRLQSLWHGSICVFYLLLMLIRGGILLTEWSSRGKPREEAEKRRGRAFAVSGALLLLLDLALLCPIALMAQFRKPVNMGLIPAIATAAYTTWKVTMASVHICRQKRRRHGNLLVTQLRTIHFVDALVSVLTLQNTLIMVNGGGGENMGVLSAISSGVIYAGIVFATLRLTLSGRRTAL